MAEIAAYAMGKRPWLSPDDPLYKTPFVPPIRIRLVVSDFNITVRGVIEPKLLKWFPNMLRARGYEIKRHQPGSALSELVLPNGSQIQIVTHAQSEKEGTLAGWEGHLLAIDEPCPEDAWIESYRGLTGTGGHAILSLTPTRTSPHSIWIRDKIYRNSRQYVGDKADIEAFEMSIYENVGYGLQAEFVERYKRNIPREEWASRIYGRFEELCGLVYSLDGDKEEHYWIAPFEIPDEWTRVIAVDPHPEKDTFVSFCAINPRGEKFFYNEIQSGLPADLVGKAIMEREPRVKKNDGSAYLLVDSAAQSIHRSTTGANFIRALGESGIRCPMTYFERHRGSVNAGILDVQRELAPQGNPSMTKIRFFRTLVRHRYQIGSYMWGEDNKPVKKNDDFPDCIRAIVMAHIKPPRMNGNKRSRLSLNFAPLGL
jgi:hypothetical protein